MPVEITMPRLSDTMQEGTLVKWRVKVGDAVKSGDVLADIETDKATMELQSYDEGTVASLAVKEGQTVAVGKVIVVLAGPGETVESAAAASAAGREVVGAAATGEAAVQEAVGTSGGSHVTFAGGASTAVAEPGEGGRARVSPLARKIAEEHGLDPAALRGTGPAGRVIKRDVLDAVQGKQAMPTVVTVPRAGVPRGQQTSGNANVGAQAAQLVSKTISLSSTRKTIARRLVESKTTIPHFTVTTSVDMELLLGPRGAKQQLETQGIKLSVNDFVVRAAALALLQFPEVNASWAGSAGDEQIQQHGTVNLGVAVALPRDKGGGLVVPVLRDAQNLSLRAIHTRVAELAEKARGRGLSIEEMAGGTFTISNLGMFGVDHFEAIINPPQAAILAVGAAITKPVVREGQIVVGQEMSCTLSADHRLIDGAVAAQFLQAIKQMLENPAVLLV